MQLEPVTTAQKLWLRLLLDTILAKYIIFNTGMEAVKFDITPRSIYLEGSLLPEDRSSLQILNGINALIISQFQENRMVAEIFGVPSTRPRTTGSIGVSSCKQQSVYLASLSAAVHVIEITRDSVQL